mgnify:CR=1
FQKKQIYSNNPEKILEIQDFFLWVTGIASLIQPLDKSSPEA